MRSKIYKKYSLIFLVALLNVSTFSLWSGYALSYKTYSTYFESVSTRIVRIGQKIYEVEHYTTTSEYPALETPDRLVIGGSTLLRESADETRVQGNYTLGAVSCTTDDGGSTAMVVAALDMFYDINLFALGDIINNWVGFTDPVKQRLLEARFSDFKGELVKRLEASGIEPTKKFLKLASKSFFFSQKDEDVFLEGLPNGLSKGILRAIEEEGLSGSRDDILRVSVDVFREMKDLTLVEKTKWAFEETERALEAGELRNPPSTRLPADWDDFKQKMLDLARVVDEKFIKKGILSPEGQSLRNLIFVGAMYVSGYLREGALDETKFEDSLRIIGNVFGVTELGFAAPAAHGQDVVLVARTGSETGDVITTQTDISRFDESHPYRSPIYRMELWVKKRNADGEVIYGDEVTYDGDVKPEVEEGGKLVAADWVIERIKNAKEAIYLPCGSAFTSVAPILMTDGIPQALAEKKAEDIPIILTLKPHQDSETVGLKIVEILKALERSMQHATGTELKLDEVISDVVIFKPDINVPLSEDILNELSAGIPEFLSDGRMFFNPEEGRLMFGEKTPRGLTAVVNRDNPQWERLVEIGAEDQHRFERQLEEEFPGISPQYIGSEIAPGPRSGIGDIRIFWPGDDWLDYPSGFGIHGAEEFRFRFAPWTIREVIEYIVETHTGP